MKSPRATFPEMTEAEEVLLRAELLRRAAVDYEQSGYLLDAAECWAELGENSRGGDLCARAKRPDRAAPLLLAAGRFSEALALYQTWETSLPPDDEAGRVRALLGQSACVVLERARRPPSGAAPVFPRARAFLERSAEQAPLTAARCWRALGEYGHLVRRYDLLQEGYETALVWYARASAPVEERETCRAYLAAARAWGDRLLTRDLEGRYARLRPPPGAELLRQFPHDGIVLSAAFSPDGRRALTGSSECLLRLWHLETGLELRRFAHDLSVVGVAFAADGRHALTVADQLRFWDLEGHGLPNRFGGRTAVFAAALTPDGRRALSTDQSGEVVLWDVAAGRELCRLAHEGPAYAAALSADGRVGLSGGGDRTARWWDLDYRRELLRLPHDRSVRAVALLPDGRCALSGSEDGTLRLWSLRRRRELHRFAQGSPVQCMAVSADGRYALSGGDGGLWFWDLKRRRELHRFACKGRVRCAAFAPDGKHALSGGDDKQLSLWRLPVGGSTAEERVENTKNGPGA